MKIEIALKRRDAGCQSMRDLYRIARMCGMPHAELHAEIDARMSTHMRGAPHWARCEVQGYAKALDDALYDTALIHGGMYEGEFHSTRSSRDDYYGKAGIDPADWMDGAKETGFYWMTTSQPKPFFVGEK